NTRKLLKFNSATQSTNPFVAVTFRKSDLIAKVEENTLYDDTIKDSIIKRQMGLPLPIVKVLYDTTIGSRGPEPSVDFDVKYYAVDGGRVYIDIDLVGVVPTYAIGLYDKSFSLVTHYTLPTAYQGKDVKGLMIDLDSYIPRYIEISYIALTVKKSDVSVNVKGEMKGAYPYKFKYFNTSG